MKRKFPHRIIFLQFIAITLIYSLLFGCSADVSNTTLQANLPTEESRADGLTDEEVVTLNSLKMVDDYPLYTMHYYGEYDHRLASAGDDGELLEVAQSPINLSTELPSWACSLFAALGDEENMFYGRNFDWEFSPAVLLFTDPQDGYASVSMVDIAYLGFGGTRATLLPDLPLIERSALLDAPFLPFDGMNETGLTVGMAAVPPGDMRPDPQKETIDSLMVIRKMLDHAGTVDEAVAILESYNIDYGGGPPLHYLIADASGDSALVEFYQGEMFVIPNENPWHLATNFLRTSVGASTQGVCERYDRISLNLSESDGQTTGLEAIDLLEEVSQANTQWSVVYGMLTGEVLVVMDRQYEDVYTFALDYSGE
jgi:uncharacterized protein YceK